jgi:hypothetical protein
MLPPVKNGLFAYLGRSRRRREIVVLCFVKMVLGVFVSVVLVLVAPSTVPGV